MSTTISHFKTTYIYGTTCLDFTPSTVLPAYQANFDLAKSAEGANPIGGMRPWRFPWPYKMKGRQKFWERFIDVRLDDLSSATAFKFLVPFRVRLARVSADWLKPGKAYIDGYWFPHRAVVVVWISAKNDEGYTLDELIEHIVKIRQTGIYTVTWLNNNTKSQLNLNNMAGKALDHLLILTQQNKDTRTDDNDPFIITTVIKGDYDEDALTKSILNNGPIHKLLFTMCTGEKPFQLPDDDCERRRIKKLGSDALPSDILYARYRARAGWFPQSFSRSGRKFPLGCYHNNLTFASMQTDSLLAAIRFADEKLRNNQSVSSLSLIAKPAAILLGGLYGPNPKKMYQSYSVREQIRRERDIVNNVRQYFLPGGKLLLDD